MRFRHLARLAVAVALATCHTFCHSPAASAAPVREASWNGYTSVVVSGRVLFNSPVVLGFFKPDVIGCLLVVNTGPNAVPADPQNWHLVRFYVGQPGYAPDLCQPWIIGRYVVLEGKLSNQVCQLDLGCVSQLNVVGTRVVDVRR